MSIFTDNLIDRAETKTAAKLENYREAMREVSERHFKMLVIQQRIKDLRKQINSDNDIINRLNRGYLFEIEDSFNVLGTIRDLKNKITEILRSLTLVLETMAGTLPERDLAMLLQPFIDFLTQLRDWLTLPGLQIHVPVIGDVIEILRTLAELGRLKQIIPDRARERMNWDMFYGDFYEKISVPEEWLIYIERIQEAIIALGTQLPIYLIIILASIIIVIINFLKKLIKALHLDFDLDFSSINLDFGYELNVNFDFLDMLKMDPPKNMLEMLVMLIPMLFKCGIPLILNIKSLIAAKLKEIYGLYYYCVIDGTSRDQYLSAAYFDIMSCNNVISVSHLEYNILETEDKLDLYKDYVKFYENKTEKYRIKSSNNPSDIEYYRQMMEQYQKRCMEAEQKVASLETEIKDLKKEFKEASENLKNLKFTWNGNLISNAVCANVDVQLPNGYSDDEIEKMKDLGIGTPQIILADSSLNQSWSSYDGGNAYA